MKRKIVFIAFLGAFWLSGCAQPVVSNQAAEYWYRQMAKEISRHNLDLAGDHYASLTSEHVRSPLIKEATLMMAMAHLENEEYLLANFYLDEYVKRYSSKGEVDRPRFLKLVADYKGIIRAGRDQKLLLDGVDRAGSYAAANGDSELAPYAATLHTRTRLAASDLELKIADLYGRLGKPDAAAYYRQKARFGPAAEGEVAPPSAGWPRSWFE
ncbi:MAG: outer membrane protein assembly factor BamD [Campylobacterales bacterium]